MLVIGLHGWFLHPVAILICDVFVYCEFLMHPIVLLITSTKLREEVKTTVKRFSLDMMPWLWMLAAEIQWKCK